jgi:hypothetical protein
MKRLKLAETDIESSRIAELALLNSDYAVRKAHSVLSLVRSWD